MMGYGEITVTVKRQELLERLKENRKTHAEVYADALKFWQEELQSVVDKMDSDKYSYFPPVLERLRKDCPKSYTDEYDKVIDMFEMSCDEEIKVESSMFNQFCRDEWDWKDSVLSNKFYKMSESRRK